MKPYKLMILSIFFSLCSCDGFSSGADDSAIHGNQEQTDTDKKDYDTAMSDSINELKERAEALEDKLYNVSIINDEQDSKIKSLEEEKGKNSLAMLIGCGLGVLGIVISTAAIRKTSKYKARLDRHRQDIDNMKSQLSENSNNQCGHGIKASREYSSLSTRLDSLEKELAMLKGCAKVDYKDSYMPEINKHTEMKNKQEVRLGYFGTVVSCGSEKGYFKKLLETEDNEARFSAKIHEEKAEFRPIASLPAIKSSDYMDLAIEFDGVSRSEAMSMKIIRDGVAKKDGTKWFIEQKALITLKK